MQNWQERFFEAIPKEEREGLHLVGPCWELTKDAKDPSRFFSALLRLASPEAFLFVEGGDHPPELREFLEKNGVTSAVRPALGTIWPRQRLFTLSATAAALQALSDLTRGMSPAQVCGHVHLFTTTAVLVEGYDAFTWRFFVSQAVPEEQVRAFCEDLGVTYAVSAART